MLTLLLAMALLAIFSAAMVSSITFEIKRDREEEMIHRGVQYSRAIRAYYKKFGRYPTKLEDLESSNNWRFLRKRYKDPLNCQASKCADFKLLHFGEVQMTLSGMGGGVPGANALGPNGALNGNGSAGFAQTSTFGANSGFGTNTNSSFGQNAQAAPAAGSDGSQPGTPDAAGTNASGTSPGSSTSSSFASGQIIGGPIVGVASVVKDKTIREFNHKTKYKDWVFVYDPAQDVGRLITTPYQPILQGFGPTGIQNGNGQNGTGTGFGNGNGVISSPSPNNSPGGLGTPNPPSNSPPQQQ